MEGVDQNEYIDSAIRAVQNKKQVPEIDFTLHTMEDGTQVSTQERVCKGTSTSTMLALNVFMRAIRDSRPHEL